MEAVSSELGSGRLECQVEIKAKMPAMTPRLRRMLAIINTGMVREGFWFIIMIIADFRVGA